MTVRLVDALDYSGNAGKSHIRELQLALQNAIAADDWTAVRRLDKACEIAIDKVIEASQGDPSELKQTLSELKGVYSRLIVQFKCEAQAIAI